MILDLLKVASSWTPLNASESLVPRTVVVLMELHRYYRDHAIFRH